MTRPNDYLMHELLHGLSLVNSLLEDACDSGRNVEHGPALFEVNPEIAQACESAMRAVFDAYQVVGKYHLVGSSAPQAGASDAPQAESPPSSAVPGEDVRDRLRRELATTGCALYAGRHIHHGCKLPYVVTDGGNRDVPDLDHAIALIEELNAGV